MTNTKEESNFKGLSNDELVIIYNRFEKYISNLDKNLDAGCAHKKIDTPAGPTIRVINLMTKKLKI